MRAAWAASFSSLRWLAKRSARQAPVRERRLDRAARLALVPAVAEAAGGRERR